ncbi:hypothetical protein OS493_037447 [Desmophyllum pertusum]|uniref:OTU domain-containing protein n=1 Tax=Desmophyllum pertusum TaxID=174260 RepID=A0A9W9Y734_9CNID|nr:hypothetical protein OS493_037447 [Desmophyllum pertusum]
MKTVYYKDFPCDDLATTLIPEDVTAEVDNQVVALSTTGNGDCLFNASSIVLFGNESVAALLRLLVAGELHFNRSFYADNEVFTETTTSNPELYPDVLFAVALTKRGDRKFSETGNREEAVKEEALVACEGWKFGQSTWELVRPKPLCVVTAEPSASEKQDFPSTSTSGTRKPKQGTLFSFFKPKASTVVSANSPNAPPAKPNVSKRTALTAGHSNKKEEPDVKTSTPNSAALKRKIMFKWKDEFPWLTIREEDDAILCSVCCQAPRDAGKTQFIMGCKSEKKETMQIHGESNGHLKVQKAVLAQQRPVRETVLAQSFFNTTKDLQERDRREVAVKMTTAYFIAKEELRSRCPPEKEWH